MSMAIHWRRGRKERAEGLEGQTPRVLTSFLGGAPGRLGASPLGVFSHWAPRIFPTAPQEPGEVTN